MVAPALFGLVLQRVNDGQRVYAGLLVEIQQFTHPDGRPAGCVRRGKLRHLPRFRLKVAAEVLHQHRGEHAVFSERAGRTEEQMKDSERFTVVNDDQARPDKIGERSHRFRKDRRPVDLLVPVAGQRRGLYGLRHTGIDGGAEGGLVPVLREADRGDIEYPRVHASAVARQRDRAVGIRVADRAGNAVRNEITLTAEDDLDAELLCGLARLREGMDHAVIGHSDRLMPPFRRALHDLSELRRRVHRAHLGVQVELYALVRRSIGADLLGVAVDVVRKKAVIALVTVKAEIAADQQLAGFLLCFFQKVHRSRGGQLVREQLHDDRVRLVRHGQREHVRAALFRNEALHGKQLAAHGDMPGAVGQVRHAHELRLQYLLAVDDVRGRKMADIFALGLARDAHAAAHAPVALDYGLRAVHAVRKAVVRNDADRRGP